MEIKQSHLDREPASHGVSWSAGSPFAWLCVIRSAICAATRSWKRSPKHGYYGWNKDQEIRRISSEIKSQLPISWYFYLFLPADWDLAHNETFLGMSQRVSSGSLSTSVFQLSSSHWVISWPQNMELGKWDMDGYAIYAIYLGKL